MRPDECCTVEKCDIFEFMTKHVGMTILHPGGFHATRRLIEKCHIDKNTYVVDIACGKGTTSIYLAENYGCKVVGIDISEELILDAKTLAKRKGVEHLVNFYVGDALDLPFSDNTFDVAISQAMLVLVNDKKKSIEESVRVVKSNGYIGWLELSWKKEPDSQFLRDISDVICAYCMTNVETFSGWEELFKDSRVKELQTEKFDMQFSAMDKMFKEEGFANTIRIMMKYLFNSDIRKRMIQLEKFFKEHQDVCGYGIFTAKKDVDGV
ncbi:class I SAM-dependent methyltransferase [Alkaliphilus peptidifermentans]|uniref:Ubiquinone/menaquinone biosynthesis C-methylase UbiE n=1 Tax=Alkaliphilus peptidifermentans DSM 18978 TaxID=1120976 RepID=A0A1G5KQG3_9FIRM|nr:class I SAM-dependent methyltransferase [Alkaliphilus peptidifermentans]SCZ02348.1 Ubiquinone/menaquinone biosynthesis C-methylase UbiE [Alkaliphilus peptidifermentans DSM 18978]